MVNPKPDGSFDVRDAAGNLIPSPPIVTKAFDPREGYGYFDPWGNQLPTLYPPAGPAPAYWPP